MKLINDILKIKGKWSLKRVASFFSFFVSVIYAFLPVFIPKFAIHEFVFWGFITFSATAIGMTVWNKKIDKNENQN